MATTANNNYNLIIASKSSRGRGLRPTQNIGHKSIKYNKVNISQNMCSNYILTKRIGSGSFGEVYLAENINEHYESNRFRQSHVEWLTPLAYKELNFSPILSEHCERRKEQIPLDMALKQTVTQSSTIARLRLESWPVRRLSKTNRFCKQIAVKIEDKIQTSIPRIINEYKIYKYLRKHNFKRGIPRIYGYAETRNYNIMYMELLDPHLEVLFNRNNRMFKLYTVLMLSIHIINLLRNLHNVKYIHRDIKPNNFLIGRKHKKGRLYIMDFGLSKKYIRNGKHIKYNDHRSLIGTARYASINMHKGIEPTRRDELESIGYMLIYFLKGVLPWQGLKRVKRIKHIDVIGHKKINTSLDELCYNLPDCFREYIAYCRNLQFDENPNYDYMCNLFYTFSKQMGIIPCYEW